MTGLSTIRLRTNLKSIILELLRNTGYCTILISTIKYSVRSGMTILENGRLLSCATEIHRIPSTTMQTFLSMAAEP